jgi:hypothetical protein
MVPRHSKNAAEPTQAVACSSTDQGNPRRREVNNAQTETCREPKPTARIKHMIEDIERTKRNVGKTTTQPAASRRAAHTQRKQGSPSTQGRTQFKRSSPQAGHRCEPGTVGNQVSTLEEKPMGQAKMSLNKKVAAVAHRTCNPPLSRGSQLKTAQANVTTAKGRGTSAQISPAHTRTLKQHPPAQPTPVSASQPRHPRNTLQGTSQWMSNPEMSGQQPLSY